MDCDLDTDLEIKPTQKASDMTPLLHGNNRVICWFSCGANSAIATKLAIQKYGIDRVEIMYCDTGGEHPDNMRFLMDCEEWFGKKITVLKNEKYEDHFDVWDKEQWINGIASARCTPAHLNRYLL